VSEGKKWTLKYHAGEPSLIENGKWRIEISSNKALTHVWQQQRFMTSWTVW
jgi:hypothetical protein